MKTTKLLRIHGRVQGVWFRESMCNQARELGVAGWVRNRSDGTVEALVQGDAAAVENIIAWAHHGPERARVSRVEIAEGSGAFADFSRLPSL